MCGGLLAKKSGWVFRTESNAVWLEHRMRGVWKLKHVLWSQTWLQYFISSTTLEKLHNLSLTRFSHLQNEDNANSSCLTMRIKWNNACKTPHRLPIVPRMKSTTLNVAYKMVTWSVVYQSSLWKEREWISGVKSGCATSPGQLSTYPKQKWWRSRT